ncbi:o-succinylbenzoate synthase [Corynebacterium sp. TA-R-1]|uniref:o-succinylbenzoate synthase n=1 Tax=Corynebacterium stercoris TaxID=2943490 RepID=A0ABT1G2M7_9CORY|nr:o-succinylbenzoate synthase [Corynebacterium stercoris]MCP1388072.1 o-succinylbenzoate synthase [Corynebacterium stercoris]
MHVPTLEDILDRAHVVALPMAVRFRGVTTREALLIDGPAGWGEFSPFLEYAPREAAAWLNAGIEAAYLGLPAAEGAVEVNGTVPAVPASEVEAVLARFPGVRTFKIKVAEQGQTLADDISRVNRVRELRPDAVLRVDANRGWTVAEAVEAERALSATGPLEYMEQPCASVAELAELRSLVATPIAADESIRRAADPYEVARREAAQIAVVKQAPLGGVRNLVRIGRDLGLELTVASALDTAVGIDAGLVAAKLTGSRAAGLATQRLFLEDVAPERTLADGSLPVTRTTPEPERLHGLRAANERREWWFERVRACYPLLRGNTEVVSDANG